MQDMDAIFVWQKELFTQIGLTEKFEKVFPLTHVYEAHVF